LVVSLVHAISHFFAFVTDRRLIDTVAFDGLCGVLRGVGHWAARTQHGFLPGYLRIIAFGAVALGLLVYLMK